MDYNETTWTTNILHPGRLEEGIIDNLGKTGPAIFILLMIGALTSTWMLSGVVPTLIYYGMKLISPKIFLPA